MTDLHLETIEQRHRPDRRRDAIFIAVAALLIAIAIGSVTKQAAGSVTAREWTLTVFEGDLEISR
jgi:cation transporter-like permease